MDNAPIHSKLDFSDLVTQLKLLCYSKILSEVGDIPPESFFFIMRMRSDPDPAAL